VLGIGKSLLGSDELTLSLDSRAHVFACGVGLILLGRFRQTSNGLSILVAADSPYLRRPHSMRSRVLTVGVHVCLSVPAIDSNSSCLLALLLLLSVDSWYACSPRSAANAGSVML